MTFDSLIIYLFSGSWWTDVCHYFDVCAVHIRTSNIHHRKSSKMLPNTSTHERTPFHQAIGEVSEINNVLYIFEEMSFGGALNYESRSSSDFYRMKDFIRILFSPVFLQWQQDPITYNTWQVIGTCGLSYGKSIVCNSSTGPERQPPYVLSFRRIKQMDNCLMETIYTNYCQRLFFYIFICLPYHFVLCTIFQPISPELHRQSSSPTLVWRCMTVVWHICDR